MEEVMGGLMQGYFKTCADLSTEGDPITLHIKHMKM